MPESSMKISYYHKKPLTCPVCEASFKKEEMLSGGGRLIAKDITDELRRNYEPSKKAGEVYPLNYPVTVCPNCLYAAYQDDFPLIPDKNLAAAFSQKGKRKGDIELLFPDLDFNEPRNLFTGTASYMLAIGSYSFHNKDQAPTFKKGLCSLRCAWLLDDLHRKYPEQNYEKVRNILYRKTVSYYEKTIAYAQNGKERIDGIKNFGPDLDKNYGFHGVLYMYTLLLYKYGTEEDAEQRIEKLMSAKRVISKVFGSGKSSKSKPSFILEISKDLYDRVGQKVEELKGV
jgi:uncharacterized protein (DUF2225 family)